MLDRIASDGYWHIGHVRYARYDDYMAALWRIVTKRMQQAYRARPRRLEMIAGRFVRGRWHA